MGIARPSEDKSKVHSINGVILELGGKMLMGAIAFGNYHYSGSILVESMDNARPERTSVIWKRLAVVEESIDQRARIIAGCGMNNQTGRFIDNENRFILENDIQRDRFRHRPHRRWRRYLELDAVPGSKSCAGFWDYSVQFHALAVDKFFQMRAGEGWVGVF